MPGYLPGLFARDDPFAKIWVTDNSQSFIDPWGQNNQKNNNIPSLEH